MSALRHLPDVERYNLGYGRRTRLERETYRRQSLDLIRRAQRAGVAQHARLPRFHFDDRYHSQDGYRVPAKTGYAAQVAIPSRTIHVAPRTVEGAFGSYRPNRRYDRHAVLHEWAHTLQRKMGDTRTEGGAEDFKILAERKARLGRSLRVYGKERRAVRHQLRDQTGKFVERGQFDPLLLHPRRRRKGFG